MPKNKSQKSLNTGKIQIIHGMHAVKAALLNNKRVHLELHITENNHEFAKNYSSKLNKITVLNQREFKKLYGGEKSTQGIVLKTNDFERPSLQQFVQNENTNDILVYANNPLYKKWNLNNSKNHLINFLLPTEDLEDLNIIKKKKYNIENYNFEEIIKKYFIKNSIVSLIFKDKNNIKVLSKIYIKDKEIILNHSFKSLNFNNEKDLKYFIKELKIIYEDLWKEQNEINTSIKLPLIIRIDNQNLNTSLKIENTFKNIDLIRYYSIKNFDKDYIYYEIIFNGTPQNFIKIMNDRNYNFDTQNKIWILK